MLFFPLATAMCSLFDLTFHQVVCCILCTYKASVFTNCITMEDWDSWFTVITRGITYLYPNLSPLSHAIVPTVTAVTTVTETTVTVVTVLTTMTIYHHVNVCIAELASFEPRTSLVPRPEDLGMEAVSSRCSTVQL